MTDRIALVTGGSRGLGRAIARRLADGGTTPVVTFHRDAAAAEACVAELRASAPAAAAQPLDLADGAAIEAAVAATLASFGRIDALVHNAFTWSEDPAKVQDLDPAEWRRQIDANVTGPFLLTRAVLPAMRAQRGGRIVFVGSLAMRGEPGRAPYSTSKCAQLGLMHTLAREYAAEGITANMVSPGYIAAGQFERFSEALRARALASVPMQRAGTAEEVAEAVSYFASAASGYTTGQVLGVDGGAP